MSAKTNLGPVTAYADAVAQGFKGTREEFGEWLANAGKNAQAVAENLAETKVVLQQVNEAGTVAVGNINKAADDRIEDINKAAAEKKEEIEGLDLVEEVNQLSEAIADLKFSDWQKVGETPFITTEKNKYLLRADGECTYSIRSDTVAVIDENTVWDRLNNCTANHDKGYWEIISNDDATSLYSTYAQVQVSGLIVGQEYKLIIDGRGLENNVTTGKPWLGYVQLINSSNTVYAKYQPIYVTPNPRYDQVTFVATEETTKIRVQIALSSFESVGGITAHFHKIYINHSDGGNEVTPVIEETTGTFTGNIEVGQVESGINITSTPTCEVYTALESGTHIPKSRLEGKMCVCFGDSIVGNMASPNDYPTVLGDITGMTVINAGFGGCRMSASMETVYNAYSMVKLADAITTGDWTEQDAGLSEVTISHYAPHIEALKSIDWSKVDFITIGYGTNDIANFVPVDNTEDPLDTTTVLGGLRYSLQEILTAYPHIKVLILTPIYRYFNSESMDSDEKEFYGQRKFTTWTDGILEVAKEYKVPGVDMYRTLGFNKFTRAYYFPSNDGTHPNILGLKVIAGKVAGKLLSEY